MPILIQICIVAATIALVGIAVALISTLGQVRATAAQVERTMADFDTTLPDLKRALIEAHELLDTFGRVGARVDRMAEQVEAVGSRAIRASGQLVDEVLVPATRAAAIARGVRVGVSTLVGTVFNRKHREPSSRLGEGGNHHE